MYMYIEAEIKFKTINVNVNNEKNCVTCIGDLTVW